MRVRTEGIHRRALAKKVNGIYVTNLSSLSTSVGFRRAVTDEYPYKAFPRRRRGKKIALQNENGRETVRLHSFFTHRITGWSSKSSVTIDNTPSGWQKPTYTGELAGFIPGAVSIYNLLPAGNSWYDALINISPENPYKDFVLAKAFSAIREADVQLANYVIELPQLIASLANPFQLLFKMSRKIQSWYMHGKPVLCPDGLLRQFNRPGKVSSPKRLSKTALREASNRWLELQFGLLPAWDDTIGIIEEIDNTIEQGDKVNFGKGGYRDKQQLVMGRDSCSLYDAKLHFTYKYERYTQYNCKVYFKHLVEMSRFARMGLTASNLFDVIWEATPWSFVIDWVYGVGDWLHTLQKLPQVHLYGNYVTRMEVIKLQCFCTHVELYSQYARPVSGTYGYRNVAVGRTINHTLPAYPQPNLRWFNVTRSLNALSLVLQKLTRGK